MQNLDHFSSLSPANWELIKHATKITIGKKNKVRNLKNNKRTKLYLLHFFEA